MKFACMAGNYESQHDNCAFRNASEEYFSNRSADVVQISALCAVRNCVPVRVCLVDGALWGVRSAMR